MREFIILADCSENLHKKTWWKFWVKRIEEEVIENEDFRVTIKYVKLLGRVDTNRGTNDFLSDKLYNNLCSVNRNDALPMVGNDEEINRKLSLEIFPEIVKSKGFGDSRNTFITFIDDERIDVDYLTQLAKMCKGISVVSGSFNNYIADKIFKETGLIIESKKGLQEVKCDFIVTNNGEIYDFDDKKKYEVDIRYDLLPSIHVKVDSLRLIKWLINQKIIELSECEFSFSKNPSYDNSALAKLG